MHLSSVRGVACAEEIAAGTLVSTTQQDPSFQFPAPLSIPRFISCRDMWSGETGGKNATFSRYCTAEPKTRKLILSKAIFVIMIWIKSIGRFQTGLAGFSFGGILHLTQQRSQTGFKKQVLFSSHGKAAGYALRILLPCPNRSLSSAVWHQAWAKWCWCALFFSVDSEAKQFTSGGRLYMSVSCWSCFSEPWSRRGLLRRRGDRENKQLTEEELYSKSILSDIRKNKFCSVQNWQRRDIYSSWLLLVYGWSCQCKQISSSSRSVMTVSTLPLLTSSSEQTSQKSTEDCNIMHFITWHCPQNVDGPVASWFAPWRLSARYTGSA